MIAVACDHTALKFKEALIERMRERGFEVRDYGTRTAESVDYPVYAEKVAQAVVNGDADRGVLICGTGIGMSIAAGKVRGTRCACCSDAYSAVLSRRHNDANILCLGARVLGIEAARMIVDSWLDAEFEGGRHAVRVGMFKEIEDRQYAQ